MKKFKRHLTGIYAEMRSGQGKVVVDLADLETNELLRYLDNNYPHKNRECLLGIIRAYHEALNKLADEFYLKE